ncbi:MAG: threonine-phosphate decarboxylase [Acidaminobacteraceae bacterium]
MNNRFEHGGNIYKINREYGIIETDIIDFSANINPLGMSELGKAAYINALNMVVNYPDPEYIKLKDSISNYHNIRSDNLFIGNGAIEMIYKTFDYIKPGAALVIAPTFVEYERALNRIGVIPDFYILKEEDNFIVNIEQLKSHAANYDLIVICSPNNPTGKLVEKEKIVEFLRFVEENNLECKLFLDEAFIDFISEEESMIDKIHEYKNLFILRSATKFFAIPGLRIGYLISSNKNLRNFYENQHIPWSINTVAEEVLIASLSDKDYIERTVSINRSSRIYLYEELSRMHDLKVYQSKGSYILFKLLKNVDLRALLLDKSILIRSCGNYIGLDNSYYRVAVKSHEQNVILVKAIEEVLSND